MKLVREVKSLRGELWRGGGEERGGEEKGESCYKGVSGGERRFLAGYCRARLV